MNSVHVQVRSVGAAWACEVVVEQEGRRSLHDVQVSPADLERWGSPGAGDDEAAVEDLVRRSFEFLLQRESATSILRSFDLAVIQRYFPEYDQRFRARDA